uniref:Ig-like domain-containing protein n=1 Tax=Anopheles culicifacies TaxID=139723 RepID=A0A182MMN8_9DIPT
MAHGKAPHGVAWQHQKPYMETPGRSSHAGVVDQVVQHNSKSGVIMSSTALALQTVTRHQAGNYTCIASNVEGDGESNTVNLKVIHSFVFRSANEPTALPNTNKYLITLTSPQRGRNTKTKTLLIVRCLHRHLEKRITE